VSVALWLEDEGPGSYDQIVEYIEAVLECNTYVAHDVYDERYRRNQLARGLAYSILHRLGARGNECIGRSNDEASWSPELVDA
jgi:hypothetical protein